MKCVAPECDENDIPTACKWRPVFHVIPFPKSEARRKLWLRKLKLDEDTALTEESGVCTLHFDPRVYDCSKFPVGKIALRPKSVPSSIPRRPGQTVKGLSKHVFIQYTDRWKSFVRTVVLKPTTNTSWGNPAGQCFGCFKSQFKGKIEASLELNQERVKSLQQAKTNWTPAPGHSYRSYSRHPPQQPIVRPPRQIHHYTRSSVASSSRGARGRGRGRGQVQGQVRRPYVRRAQQVPEELAVSPLPELPPEVIAVQHGSETKLLCRKTICSPNSAPVTIYVPYIPDESGDGPISFESNHFAMFPPNVPISENSFAQLPNYFDSFDPNSAYNSFPSSAEGGFEEGHWSNGGDMFEPDVQIQEENGEAEIGEFKPDVEEEEEEVEMILPD